jgi:hypothetical protein
MSTTTSRVFASGFGALVAAAGLAACNSGLGNPYTTATVAPTSTPTVVSTAPAGQTTQATFTSAGGALALGPYANAAGTTVSLASTWGANNQTQSPISFQGWLAAGSSDLNPANANWIAYNGTGAVVIYLAFTALPATSFTQSPALTFTTSAAVAGSSCTIASFANGAWSTALSGGVLSNGSKTISFAAQTPAGGSNIGNTGSPKGPTYLALVCQ